MTFKELYNSICKKLRINNDREIENIKNAINEQIKEFCEMREWTFTKEIYTLTLDGSNSYDLSTLLTNRCTVLKITNSSGDILTKVDYENYLGLDDKTDYYSIYGGNTLYLEGTSGDYKIHYTSYGGDGSVTATDLYPLSTDADEITITKYYPEIIKQMVVVQYLEETGDVGTIQLETIRKDRLISVTKKKESRENNSGHYHKIGRR